MCVCVRIYVRIYLHVCVHVCVYALVQEIPVVSILFSDIVGFTSYSASISASELVQFLNQLYTTFDHLTIVNEVLKIETIGDAVTHAHTYIHTYTRTYI